MAAALLIVGMAAVPVAWLLHGAQGLVAVGVALGICLAGGLAALTTDWLLASPQLFVVRVLTGMMMRMGVPLGILLAVYSRGGPLVDAGLGGYVVVFYLVVLAGETWLLIPPRRAPGSGGTIP